MNKNTEATFVRRKFTITEELDEELERMANNNYQGNVSLCLRQAIADHQETLHGNGELTRRHIVESITHIEDQISELTQSINAIAEQSNASQTGSSEVSIASIPDETVATSGADQIIAALSEADEPLRVADIIERIEMQPVDVQSGLGYLVDCGHVFSTEDEPARYQLAATTFGFTERDNPGGMTL